MLLQTFNEEIVSVGSRVHIRDIESGEREVYTLTRPTTRISVSIAFPLSPPSAEHSTAGDPAML